MEAVARLRAFGRPPRIMGIDVARGLAVIGMFVAHFADRSTLIWSQPTTWSALVNGRSAILFAVLAGVSVALVNGRTRLPERAELPRLRLQLIGRGIGIFLFGAALELLGTPIAIVLGVYGLLFIACIPFLRIGSVALFSWAAGIALTAPILLAALRVFLDDPHGPAVTIGLFGVYPLPIWLSFALVGMGLGRLPLTSPRIAGAATVIGVLIATVGYGMGLALWPAIAGTSQPPEGPAWLLPEAATSTQTWAMAAFSPWEHSSGLGEVIGSGGFAIAVIGLCLLLARPLRYVIYPVAALGSMPLTVYCAQIVIYLVVAGGSGRAVSHEGLTWLWITLGLAALAIIWLAAVGRGPAERLLAAASRALTSGLPPTGSS